jgi:hypothetical protein
MIDQAVGRFECQLTQQIDRFQDDMRDREAALHTELRVLEASLRAELAAVRDEILKEHASLRLEIRSVGGTVVKESARLASTMRNELADHREERFKPSLVFWLGQIVPISTLITLLARTLST